MQSSDFIIIGGGTNGLAAAGRLAKSGRTVTVLEAGTQAGGGAVTREFAPGYNVSGVAHHVTMMDRRVEKALRLRRHGLSYVAQSLPTTALSVSGAHLVMSGAYGEGVTGGISEQDQISWRDLRLRLMRHAAVLKPFREITPPRLDGGADNELALLARLGLKVRGLGRDELREFLRLVLINVADVLEDELSDDRLKGVVAFDTVLGAHMGPRSPNSLMLLYNRLAGQVNGSPASLALPRGGMGSVAKAMAAAVTGMGVTIRTGARVAEIVVENDRATGVRLEDGEVLKASAIISAINPRTTLLSLLGPRHLDTGFVRRAGNIRMRGGVAKLHLALSGPPDFRGADLKSRLVIAPSVRAVEDAFNAVKYGAFSEGPVMEIVVPSAFEEGLAPQGHHVLSAVVQYAPYELKGGWGRGRAQFLKAIMAQLEAHAPGIGKLVVAAELLTPEDLEKKHGFVGGNWHHGELAVEQMFFLRPMAGLAQYETPVAGLWLAGAGSHPGGNISGAAGWNAAERILKKGGRS